MEIPTTLRLDPVFQGPCADLYLTVGVDGQRSIDATENTFTQEGRVIGLQLLQELQGDLEDMVESKEGFELTRFNLGKKEGRLRQYPAHTGYMKLPPNRYDLDIRLYCICPSAQVAIVGGGCWKDGPEPLNEFPGCAGAYYPIEGLYHALTAALQKRQVPIKNVGRESLRIVLEEHNHSFTFIAGN